MLKSDDACWRNVSISKILRIFARDMIFLVVQKGFRSGKNPEYTSVQKTNDSVYVTKFMYINLFVCRQIIHHDQITPTQCRKKRRFDVFKELRMRRSSRKSEGANVFRYRIARMWLTVNQCPNGDASTIFSPRNPQPKRGIMFVLQQVSSMKTTFCRVIPIVIIWLRRS